MVREVPNVPTGLDPQTRNFFSAIREAVNQYTLSGADSLNSSLTADNLTGIAGSLDSLLSTTIPPMPTGVVVTGIFSTIMVTWNKPSYAYFSFAEIWRANAVDSLGLLIPPTGSNANGNSINFLIDAKLVGTSNGEIYADSVGPGSKHYYWVRFLSTANIAGSYNASAGIIGIAAQDIYALMQANGWTIGTDALLDGLVTSNKINDFAVTNAKIANTAITNAKIANLAVSTAQIQDLAVTSAKIQSLGVEKLYAASAWIATADILDGQITNAKIGNTIQSDNYNGTTTGWQLSKSGGNVNLNQLTVRDASGNVIMSSGGAVWDYINGAGKPANNATVGATFGSNISGQITASNASTYIANAAIRTAQIGDLSVDTLQIAGNAVTIPTSVITTASVYLEAYGDGLTLQTVTHVSTGKPILITYGFATDRGYGINVNEGGAVYGTYSATVKLLRNGVSVQISTQQSNTCIISWTDTPPAGTVTYAIHARNEVVLQAPYVFNRFINLMEVKR